MSFTECDPCLMRARRLISRKLSVPGFGALWQVPTHAFAARDLLDIFLDLREFGESLCQSACEGMGILYTELHVYCTCVSNTTGIDHYIPVELSSV